LKSLVKGNKKERKRGEAPGNRPCSPLAPRGPVPSRTPLAFFSTAAQQAAAQAEQPRVFPPFSWPLAAGPPLPLAADMRDPPSSAAISFLARAREEFLSPDRLDPEIRGIFLA